MLSLQDIISALPASGLFSSNWRWSPQPLPISRAIGRQLQGLGHVLAQFQRASDTLYQLSHQQHAPAWVAQMLDAGKPDWMIAAQRSVALQERRPRVLRPDLLLTPHGLSLVEIDSVPGGMGTTAWMSQFYQQQGFEVLGGARGMLDGFAEILPEDGVIALSEEAADYRGEMEWLAANLETPRPVVVAEGLGAKLDRPTYRFFELFDWRALPTFPQWAADPRLQAPCKPHLEEKAWLALLHSPGLQSQWRQLLRHAHLERMQQLVPFSWLVRDQVFPSDAVLPRLNVPSWREVGRFSQRERRLVLKISGFDPLCWGSRGVHIGHDIEQRQWQQLIDQALASAPAPQWLMQEFHDACIIEHPVFADDGSIQPFTGRVRLCPYYMTNAQGLTTLRGCLATIVPHDKKKIHGMNDAILCPVMLAD